MHCPLCATDGGQLVWRGARLRVMQASEAAFPAFYRVVWNAHVAEFTDLSSEERVHCLQAVAWVEQVLRERLAPSKINLAALGNQVAHLHWHVIARYSDDSHFPSPVWAAAQRERNAALEATLAGQLPAAEARMAAALDRLLA